VEVPMKKLVLIALLSIMLTSSVFCISALEKLLLPEFKGDITTVDYKVVENTPEDLIVIIDGVTYVYKIK
jgi:hypothetical protein